LTYYAKFNFKLAASTIAAIAETININNKKDIL